MGCTDGAVALSKCLQEWDYPHTSTMVNLITATPIIAQVSPQREDQPTTGIETSKEKCRPANTYPASVSG